MSGGGNYEREQAFPSADIDGDPTTTRNNSAAWVEGRGTLGHRVSLTAGLGYAHNEAFASAIRRVSRSRPSCGRPGATAVLERHAADVQRRQRRQGAPARRRSTARSSTCCRGRRRVPRWRRVPASDRSVPSAAGTSTSASNRACGEDAPRARVAYFDNEFFDLDRVRQPEPAARSSALRRMSRRPPGSGAYVNSQSFKAKGVEMSLDAMFGQTSGSRARIRISMPTSRSRCPVSALTPPFNPAFPGIPIGSFSSADRSSGPSGARPNTGSLLVSYSAGTARPSR